MNQSTNIKELKQSLLKILKFYLEVPDTQESFHIDKAIQKLYDAINKSDKLQINHNQARDLIRCVLFYSQEKKPNSKQDAKHISQTTDSLQIILMKPFVQTLSAKDKTKVIKILATHKPNLNDLKMILRM